MDNNHNSSEEEEEDVSEEESAVVKEEELEEGEGDLTGEEFEDQEGLIKLKPPRPPRKKVRETLKDPLYEEDIIEGFSFAAFENYDDLEVGQNPHHFTHLKNYLLLKMTELLPRF